MNFGVFFGAFSVNSERFIIYKARACGMAVDKHKPRYKHKHPQRRPDG